MSPIKKPNIVDEAGTDCAHIGGYFEDDAYLCQCSLPDCAPGCRKFYIDHEDNPSIPKGKILSRLIWFCYTHKCECEL